MLRKEEKHRVAGREEKPEERNTAPVTFFLPLVPTGGPVLSAAVLQLRNAQRLIWVNQIRVFQHRLVGLKDDAVLRRVAVYFFGNL